MVAPRTFAGLIYLFRAPDLRADEPIFGVCVADSPEDNADNLREDALRLADSLGGMETRDWVERVGRAVESGEVKYAELMQRRRALSPHQAGGAGIDSILETIRARLKFLDSLHRRNAKRSGT
jgi:hypothetical protein